MSESNSAMRARGFGGSWRFSLSVLLVMLAAPEALADGWKVQLQGVKALGLGYAGRAEPEDATTVWFNAAGMTELDAPWTVTAGGVPIFFGLDYTDRGSRNAFGQPLTGPTAVDGGKFASVPHFFFVYGPTDRIRIGFGLTAPHGLGDDYGTQWVGRYHATESTLEVLNFNPSFAYKVSDRLSVAAGLDAQRAKAKLSNRIDFGLVGLSVGLPLLPQSVDGGIALDAASWRVGFDLSTAIKMSERARLAVTFRSKIEHTLEGDASFDVPAAIAPLQAAGLFTPTGASTVLPMPAELSLATAVDLTSDKRWTLVADVTWTNWSVFERLVVGFDNAAQPPLSQEARFDDSARVAGGIIYRGLSRWTLRAGGLYEKSPVPDATRTPRLPEVNNLGFTIGGTWHWKPRLDIDFSWSHLVPHDAPIGLSDPLAGNLSGDVRWRTDAIAIGFSFRSKPAPRRPRP